MCESQDQSQLQMHSVHVLLQCTDIPDIFSVNDGLV